MKIEIVQVHIAQLARMYEPFVLSSNWRCFGRKWTMSIVFITERNPNVGRLRAIEKILVKLNVRKGAKNL